MPAFVPMPKCRVLIVDDNRDAADLLGHLIELLGHEAIVAYGGIEGVQVARQAQAELAFIDIGMPDMDGYAVAKTLRSDDAFSSLRLIALTAWADAATKEKAFASGFDDHMSKPANMHAVLAAIALRQKTPP